MTQEVSEAMVRAQFARTAPDIALLVGITADGLDAPIRATNWPGRIAGSRRRGLISRGATYDYFPLSFSWPGAGAGEAMRAAKLEVANFDRAISEAARTATGQPLVDIEAVRVDAPDEVELAMLEAGIDEIEIDQAKAVASLKANDYSTEPACARRYIYALTPALG